MRRVASGGELSINEGDCRSTLGQPIEETRRMAKIIKRSIVLGGHKTSISLEDDFWTSLKAIAVRERIPVLALIGQIDGQRSGNLSSAIRLYVLDDFRRRLESADLGEGSQRGPILQLNGQAELS
jgi:predicted DNA-binding ribbon-helix-helix protein